MRGNTSLSREGNTSLAPQLIHQQRQKNISLLLQPPIQLQQRTPIDFHPVRHRAHARTHARTHALTHTHTHTHTHKARL
jgi:hypothetical protein